MRFDPTKAEANYLHILSWIESCDTYEQLEALNDQLDTTTRIANLTTYQIDNLKSAIAEKETQLMEYAY